MEIWTIQDKLDPQARETAHIVHTWYRPGKAGQLSQVLELPVGVPPPSWAHEPGVICAEVIKGHYPIAETRASVQCLWN